MLAVGIKGAAVGALIACIVVFFATQTITYEHQLTDGTIEVVEWELIALNASDEVGGKFEGIFFLVSGTLGNTDKYKYYYRQGDGGIRYGELDAKTVTIYEENREDAVMQVMSYTKENPKNVNDFFQILSWDLYDINAIKKTIFRIPEGTVLREVNISLSQ